jgi:hypothetical protein
MNPPPYAPERSKRLCHQTEIGIAKGLFILTFGKTKMPNGYSHCQVCTALQVNVVIKLLDKSVCYGR